MLPVRPLPSDRLSFSGFNKLASSIVEGDEIQRHAVDNERKLRVALATARQSINNENTTSWDEAEQRLDELILSIAQAASQENEGPPPTLSVSPSPAAIQDYARFKAFSYFLRTTKLIPPTEFPCLVSDEDYVRGACMGLSQDLVRYARDRATLGDVSSVVLARNLVRDTKEQLVQSSGFCKSRLGREHTKTTKNTLSSLDSIVSKLSLLRDTDFSDEEQHSDRMESSVLIVPSEELEALYERLESREELRVRFIKKCRSGQQLARKTFSELHCCREERRDRASQLLSESEMCITNDLMPMTQEEPSLRKDESFQKLLEEYVKAKLFYTWLCGRSEDSDASPSSSSSSQGEVLPCTDFSILRLEPQDYLNGLCSLTSELVRYAERRSKANDSDAVKLCLRTSGSIHSTLQTMERYPQGFGERMEIFEKNVERLELLHYGLSVSRASCDRNFCWCFAEDCKERHQWSRPVLYTMVGLLMLTMAVVTIAAPLIYRNKQMSCLDSFHGINMLYASDTTKCLNDWVSQWNSVRQTDYGHDADPGDPRCMQRGFGSITFGSDICEMTKKSRYYIYKAYEGYEDVEFTAYGKYVSDGEILSSSGLTMVARSNHGDFEDGCTAPGYMARLYRETGQVSLQKEYYHGPYTVYTDSRRNTTTFWNGSLPTNKWIGMKFVVYTVSDDSVKLELYIDMTEGVNGGNWIKVLDVLDSPGSWRKSGSAREIPQSCEVQDGDTVLGSRDVCFLRVDGSAETEVQWTNASIRNILPTLSVEAS